MVVTQLVLQGSLPTERTPQLAPTSTGMKEVGCFEDLQLEGDFSPENQGEDTLPLLSQEKGQTQPRDLTVFQGRKGKRADSSHNTPGKGGWGPSNLYLMASSPDTWLLSHDQQSVGNWRLVVWKK